MHLVMIVNKHATKYSIQVPSLSEVVERERFLARGNSSFVSSRQSGLTSINRSKVMESTFREKGSTWLNGQIYERQLNLN